MSGGNVAVLTASLVLLRTSNQISQFGNFAFFGAIMFALISIWFWALIIGQVGKRSILELKIGANIAAADDVLFEPVKSIWVERCFFGFPVDDPSSSPDLSKFMDHLKLTTDRAVLMQVMSTAAFVLGIVLFGSSQVLGGFSSGAQ